MCYVFVILIFQPTNCNLTAKYISEAIPAPKLLSKQVATGISFSCSFNNCFAVPVKKLDGNH